MKFKIKQILPFLFAASLTTAQIAFTNIDSVFAFASRNSTAIKTTTQQSLLAKWTKVAANANTINFRNPVTFTAIDNLMLPVSFIPASAFGGPPGSLKQITLGQQYVSNFNLNPQIDIINPYVWAKVKSASVNQELTETNNLIAKKNLFESIAASFYNIISLQEQLDAMQQNMQAADSLEFIAKNKFALGLIREQDVNNANVTQLNIKDKIAQLQASLGQQYNNLKILCDISPNTKVLVSPPDVYKNSSYSAELKATSGLYFKNAVLQGEFAKSELRANRWSTFPVVSAVYYQGWQQNSNSSLFDDKSSWIQSQYIGLRISVPFPADVNKLSQNYTSKINYRVALLNSQHAQLQNDLNNQSLNLDYEKSYSAYITAKQIYEIKNKNYSKSVNQYKEGVLSTDIMLNSFTDMLNSKLNLVSTQAALEFTKSKININNLLK